MKAAVNLLWVFLSILGALALAHVVGVVNPNEKVNGLWLVVAAACIYVLAYRFYGWWLILCCSVLQADSVDLAFDCSREGLKQFRKQWPKIFQAVSRGLQHNDCNGELGDVLLKGQVTVNGDEDIKLRLSSGK